MTINGITVDISKQRLHFRHHSTHLEFEISSALAGTGQIKNSGQTPLGRHYVRAKIGQGAPTNAVFVGRRPTGEIYSQALVQAFPERDWILTRILWLCGREIGVNRLGGVDSMQRYIYIHGTPRDGTDGGCPLSWLYSNEKSGYYPPVRLGIRGH